MKKKSEHDLLNDPIKPLLIKMSIPVMLSGLLRTSYSFVDMLFASRLGGVQVASVAFVAPLFIMLGALGVGLASGGVSIIAKPLGTGDHEKASNYAAQLRLVILFIAIIISLLGVFMSEGLLSFLGISGEMLKQTVLYTKVRFFSIPFALIIQLYMTFYKSQGKMEITTRIALLGVIGNIILNAFFIYILNWGIQGLATATLLTQGIQTLVIIVDYHRNAHQFHLSGNILYSAPNWKIIRKILKIGLPLSFSHGSAQFGFLLINTLIVPYGYQVVAAFAIGNQINSLFFSPSTGIGQALTPLLAQNWGNKSVDRIRKIIKTSMIYTLVFGVIGALGIQIIVKPLGTFLAKGDETIIIHVLHYIRLMGWTIIAWVSFQTLSGIFNGFQKTRITMTIAIIRLWGLRIPGLLIFRYYLPVFEEYGVWYTMFFSNVIAAMAAVALYYIYIPKSLE